MTTVAEALAARDVAYEERAIMVIAVANVAMHLGYNAWFATDEKEPDWPVLFVELPTGQVSWHFTAEQRRTIGADIPNGPNLWDGHTTEEKYERLLKWTTRMAGKR